MLSILNPEDMDILQDVDVDRTDFHQVYENTTDKNEKLYDLVNTGILMSDHSSRLGPIAAPFVKVTMFGGEFIKFLKY